MEKKIKLMKLISLSVLFASLGIALFLSDMSVYLRWGCGAIFALGIIAMLIKRDKVDNVDEREMHIEHVSGWIAGVLTMASVSIFIILDVMKTGHYDNRLFILVSIWALSKALVGLVMGGGRGQIG